MPFTGPTNPSQPGNILLATVGKIVDGQGEGIPQCVVVITGPGGEAVSVTSTSSGGWFQGLLPSGVTLELSLPELGVFGVPVHAGSPILVVVP